MSKMLGVWNPRHKIMGKEDLIVSICAKSCSSLKDVFAKEIPGSTMKISNRKSVELGEQQD